MKSITIDPLNNIVDRILELAPEEALNPQEIEALIKHGTRSPKLEKITESIKAQLSNLGLKS